MNQFSNLFLGFCTPTKMALWAAAPPPRAGTLGKIQKAKKIISVMPKNGIGEKRYLCVIEGTLLKVRYDPYPNLITYLT